MKKAWCFQQTVQGTLDFRMQNSEMSETLAFHPARNSTPFGSRISPKTGYPETARGKSRVLFHLREQVRTFWWGQSTDSEANSGQTAEQQKKQQGDRQSSQREKIFASCASDRGLLSRIYSQNGHHQEYECEPILAWVWGEELHWVQTSSSTLEISLEGSQKTR